MLLQSVLNDSSRWIGEHPLRRRGIASSAARLSFNLSFASIPAAIGMPTVARACTHRFAIHWLLLLVALLLDAMIHTAVQAAQPAQKSGATSRVVAPSAGVVKYTPNMRMTDLAGRPDTDFVELSNGRRMRVGDLRRLDAAAKKMRAAGAPRGLPPGLKTPPAATGVRIKSAADLSAALKRSGAETLQLPSGKRVTTDQLRFLQPEVEKRLGRRIGESARQPSRTGPAIKVNAQTNWREMLKRPNDTILESPSGKRITVGEIKQARKDSGGSRGMLPTTPTVAPVKSPPPVPVK